MRKLCFVAVVMCLALHGAHGFAQVINASLTGTVSDTSGAFIPGVEITATHAGTNVPSVVLTNESGTYRFASLQPGPYQVSASLPGFQTRTFQLTLGTSQNIRQNFVLDVGTVTQAVEVAVAADELLTTMSSSVGRVLSEKQVVDLPLVGRNVINFATALTPGVVGTGDANTTFAGIAAGGSGNVNLQLDGVSVNNQRHAQGLYSATVINPDMIEEFRVVVAAVDVEGRGSAQVQARTKSGTNQFHGAGVWNIRNSAMNANSWGNNRQGITPIWYNRHQFTASLGGPVIKNKTFFFALFDAQQALQKETFSTPVLTQTARNGMFRFFPGVNNGHAETQPSGTGNTRISPVVDLLGNPLDWTRIPGATGPMRSFSVFGDALNPGDPFRRQMDPSGFMTKLIQNMPLPNAFNGEGCSTATPCDGLNIAPFRWVRRTIGGNGGSGASAQDEFNRRQINVKIDHNFNARHKLTGSYVYEHRYNDAVALSPWPNGFGGDIITTPNIVTGQFTSSFSSTLLNEFRYSYRRTDLRDNLAFGHSDTEKRQAAYDFLTKIAAPDGRSTPIIQKPALFPDHMINCPGTLTCSNRGNKSPMHTYSDTLSWTRGVHAMKFGTEFRFANSYSWSPQNIVPTVTGGAGDVPVTGIDQIPGLLNTSRALAENVLLALAGSVGRIDQRFEIREPSDTRFLDFRDTYFNDDPNIFGRVRDWHQNEISFFVKDDWRVTPNLTFNLGVRYDLFRVPYLLSNSGAPFTPGLEGGNDALYGISGRSINNWMSGGGTKGGLTKTILIGDGTANPKQGIWPSDRNNFGPAVGFAWAPSFWGANKTTIRGGYQIAYQLPGNSISWIDVDVGNLPGFTAEPADLGSGTYRDFYSLGRNVQIPIAVTQAPFEVIPVTQRAQSLSLHETGYTTPYVQTFTLGVTRSVASNLTLDVKYVGTRGVKLHSQGYNLNDANIWNNGLFEALETTRNGGDSALFDRMLEGLNLGTGIGVVGRDVTGSEALRRHATFRTNIANGDYVAVARTLNTTNIGTVQPAGQIINGGLLRSSGLFPENFISTNPQFANVTLRTNSDSSNYHSLQTQMTLRPTNGMTFQGTYTWSKALGITTSGVRDIRNRNADYTRLPTDRTHIFQGYGTFELPFGPGKLVYGGSSGILARIIEGWKLGTIVRMSSGAPMNISGRNTLYGSGAPDLIGAFRNDGGVTWGSLFGNFFPEQYQRVTDPGCLTIAATLRPFCTNTALADSGGNIVLRNAAPGQLGSLGLRTVEGPGSWDFDANIQKSFRVAETKNLTFRLDAQNVLNHPTPVLPNGSLNINSGTFGEVNNKIGNRSLQAQLRFDF
jgi:hypothetical protein